MYISVFIKRVSVTGGLIYSHLTVILSTLTPNTYGHITQSHFVII